MSKETMSLNAFAEAIRLRAIEVQEELGLPDSFVEEFTYEEDGYGEVGDWLLELSYDGHPNDLRVIKQVLQEGGGEGGAEDCECVFLFKDEYWKMDYRYYSYDGYNFDSTEVVTKVQPKEVTIIQYS